MAATAARLEVELACIEAREDEVRAWVTRHPAEHLRRQLRTLPPGPLHGFTLGVKDIIDTADLPTERGSPIYEGYRPRADAACVSLARRAGGLVVGKTVTTEFAYFQPGPTRNPVVPAHTPGGSSSGSAAAVASGMVRVAFGTQTGGSVIRPGAFCGVVAFKPTFDLVPLTGVHPLSPSFDTLGWFARDVDDARAVLDALAAAPAAVTDGGPTAGPTGLRIGVYRSHEWPDAGPATVAAVEGAARRLAGGGVQLVEIDPHPALDPLGRAHDTIMRAEAGRSLAWELREHGDRLSPTLRRLLERAERSSAERYADAQEVAVAGRAAYRALLDERGLDALLTPSAPGEAPLGLESTGDPLFNRVWSLLRVPALGLPTGHGPLGLPVGIQLVGRRWHDRALLDVGRTAFRLLGAENPALGSSAVPDLHGGGL